MTQDNKFEIVVVNADELVEKLGDGWVSKVWDNLGWHYSASYKDTGLVVFPSRDGTYHACIDFRYPSGSWVEPNDAVGATMEKLTDKIIDLMDIHERITGSKFE